MDVGKSRGVQWIFDDTNLALLQCDVQLGSCHLCVLEVNYGGVVGVDSQMARG